MANTVASTSTDTFLGGGSPQRVADDALDKVGFYGATPVVQPTTTLEAVAVSTAAVSVSATQWGYASSAQADGVVRLVNQLRADLVSLGIIKGS